MAELKTKQNQASVEEFLDKLPDQQREDSYELVKMMKKITKEEPKMWGASIVGFGSYHYKYASGHEGDTCVAGFSPRKQNLTLYMSADIKKHYKLLEKLGKHKTGVGCLYIKKLSDVDKKVLEELIGNAVQDCVGRS